MALVRIRLLHRDGPVAIKREPRLRRGGPGRTQKIRRVERETADQQRDHGFGAHIDAVGTQRDIDAADVPEACFARDEFVVGRVYVHDDLDRLAVIGQFVPRDLADIQLAVIDRRTDTQRAQRARLQDEALAALPGNEGRLVEPDEGALRLDGFAVLEADVVARKQRAQPRDPAQVDTRLDDPELHVFDHQAGSVLGDLGGNVHFFVVVGKLHRRHQTDRHVLELDGSLAGFDSLRSAERDLDGRTFAQDALHRDSDGDQRCKDRNDPDNRYPRPFFPHDRGLRQIAKIGFVSHGGLVGDWRNPRSAWDRKPRQRASSAPPPPRKIAHRHRAPPTSGVATARGPP